MPVNPVTHFTCGRQLKAKRPTNKQQPAIGDAIG